MDKPGMPKGPLQYTETTQETVSVSWNPPDDDGGGEITNYIIEVSELGMDCWRPCPGFCPKTNFTVRGLTEGKKYVVRVRAENIYGVSEPLEGKPVVAKSPFDPPGPPSQPQVVGYTPSSCSLKWNPPTSTGGKPISGYYIEKRERGGEWVRVNHYPTPNTSYTVQDLREGNKYEFRVVAVNEAGPGEPSRPTEPIIAGHQRCKYHFILIYSHVLTLLPQSSPMLRNHPNRTESPRIVSHYLGVHHVTMADLKSRDTFFNNARRMLLTGLTAILYLLRNWSTLCLSLRKEMNTNSVLLLLTT